MLKYFGGLGKYSNFAPAMKNGRPDSLTADGTHVFIFSITHIKKTNNKTIMNENEQKQGLQIELTPEKAQGEYANFAIITHSSSEFIVDFARMLPGLQKAQVRSRVILAPEHAKRLFLALNDNLKKYESTHGEILLNDMRPFPITPNGTKS